MRKGELGKAIRKLNRIEKHFLDFIDDQFPYHMHSYCYNKMTLSAYYKFIKFEDNIFSHKYYVKAAKCLVRCYLELYDNPEKYKPTQQDEEEEPAPPPQQDRSNPAPKRGRGRGRGGNRNKGIKSQPPPEEKITIKEKNKEDEEVRKILSVKNPIKSAMVHLDRLLLYNNDFETNSLAFEVFLRRKKYLLALKSLVRMSQINATSTQCVEAYNRFNTDVFNENQKHHDLVQEVIKLELEDLKLILKI